MRPVSTYLLSSVAFIATVSVAHAGIRPSFELERCTKNSTDIVVVTEGAKIDGDLEVLESWKGGLKAGDQISVPALAAFESPESRAIYEASTTPDHVTCKRMVLFLERKGGTTPTTSTWAPAAPYGGFKVSIVWIEDGKAFAFFQIMNPGDSVLVPYLDSEKELRDGVDRLLGEWSAIEKARRLSDPSERARALEPFTHVASSEQAGAALEGIAAAGSAALPVLRPLLADETLGWRRAEVVTTFASAGGPEVAPELTKILETEFAYWKETGPKLARGWWTNQADIMPVENRYNFVLETIRSLGNLRAGGAEMLLGQFRDFWRSLPQLEDPSGLTQMSQACDVAIKEIKAGGPPRLERQGRWREGERSPEPASEPAPPLTTAEDEARVTELEAALARELAAERSRPPTRRPVLRGVASGGETNAELTHVFDAPVTMSYDDWQSFQGKLVARAQGGSWPRPLSTELWEVQQNLRGNVRACARLLAADHAGLPFDVEKEWRALRSASGDHDAGRVDGVRSAFILDSLDALDDKWRPCALCACCFALDLWRFEHDLRADDRLIDLRYRPDWGGDVGELLVAAIPKLDARGVALVDSQVAMLEATIPSLADEIRRRRLACGCFFRAYHQGELKGFRSDSTWGERGADPTPLDHLSARARLTNRRVGAIRREWEKLDALLHEYEEAVARLERPKRASPRTIAWSKPLWDRLPGTSPESWEDFLGGETSRYLGDVSRLRLMRVFLGAQRFHLANGRWPSSVAEAVGKALAEKLGDPLRGGKAFVLTEDDDGFLRASLAREAGRMPASWSYRLEPPKE